MILVGIFLLLFVLFKLDQLGTLKLIRVLFGRCDHGRLLTGRALITTFVGALLRVAGVVREPIGFLKRVLLRENLTAFILVFELRALDHVIKALLGDNIFK